MESRAGVMGHITREQALVCLQNCPLLADLAEWSHWDVVFRPALKDLKDFIQKHGGVYQCTTVGKVLCMILVLCKEDCVKKKTVQFTIVLPVYIAAVFCL